MTLGPVLITPRSRGRVRLRSADPADKPRIAHQLARRARGRRRAGGRDADRARDRRHRAAARGRHREELFPGAGRRRRRPRGRPAAPRRAALPPGRHLPDGHRRRRGGRRAAARARRRRPARGRRLDHAADHRRQHERADDHDRRACRRPDPRRRRRCRREPASCPEPADTPAAGDGARLGHLRRRLRGDPGRASASGSRRTPSSARCVRDLPPDAERDAANARGCWRPRCCAASGSPYWDNTREQAARLRATREISLSSWIDLVHLFRHRHDRARVRAHVDDRAELLAACRRWTAGSTT